jgi:two-component system, NtrC family, sensor kinase
MSFKVKQHILSLLSMISIFVIATSTVVVAQEQTIVLSKDMIENDFIHLDRLEGWIFKPGNIVDGATPALDTSDWQILRPSDVSAEILNEIGAIEGWFRIRVRLDSTFADTPLFWSIITWGAIDLYVDGNRVKQYGVTSSERGAFRGYNPLSKFATHANVEIGRDYLIAVYLTDHLTSILNSTVMRNPYSYAPSIRLSTEDYNIIVADNVQFGSFHNGAMVFATSLIALIFWILYLQNRNEPILRSMTATTSVVAISVWLGTGNLLNRVDLLFNTLFVLLWQYSLLLYTGLIVISLYMVIMNKSPFRIWHVVALVTILMVISYVYAMQIPPITYFVVALLMLAYLFLTNRSALKNANVYLLWGAITTFLVAVLAMTLTIFRLNNQNSDAMLLASYYLAMPLCMFMYISRRFRDSIVEVKTQAEIVVVLSREKQDILAAQNELLEKQVSDRTSELQESLEELKKAQEQLIQSEKMASLGQLTAGIAHEIKNPLNFVTNFSDLTRELVMEAREEMAALGLSPDQVDRFEPILGDIEMNVSKIFEHGRRADNIVKGMLQHSRGKAGERQDTDINELIGEYLNLAYHGLRAQDPSFNVTLKTNFDPNVGMVAIVPQDFSRAILNLVNNACFAADQKKRTSEEPGFKPTVTVSTKMLPNEIEIVVHDNGTGIPDHVKNKIFEPFFTTKPTGVGTGLGLSLTYEIIVHQHQGSLEVNSKAGDFTEFRIIIPRTQ